MAKPKEKTEFGDFQTPYQLAVDVVRRVHKLDVEPKSILEPTCGKGNILYAACEEFPTARKALGVEISSEYFDIAASRFFAPVLGPDIQVINDNFFEIDWSNYLQKLPDPLLVIGNPPWVTNSELGLLKSDNLPVKANIHKLSGFDAKTGKSNFDISEWMLIKMCELLRSRNSTLAMLCKTAVARKVIKYVWKKEIPINYASLFKIDAQKHFGAAVDSCLMIIRFGQPATCNASIYNSLEASEPEQIVGYKNGQLIASIEGFDSLEHLHSYSKGEWRSGIKHDCSKVMELRFDNGVLINGFNEKVEIEDDYIYPLLKSSDLGKANLSSPRRFVIVTQKRIGDDTSHIQIKAPKTWNYLTRHSDLLDGRKSSIYNERSRFSVFGIGDYTFAPWKVAISGFYKSLFFHVVPPHDNRPVVIDDTCYSLPFYSSEEAQYVAELLNSSTAQTFLSSLVFWDSKRPVTVDLLNSLDIPSLELFLQPQKNHRFQKNKQIGLF